MDTEKTREISIFVSCIERKVRIKKIYSYYNNYIRGFTFEDIPKDDDFELIDYAENYLCSKVSRLCITLKKK